MAVHTPKFGMGVMPHALRELATRIEDDETDIELIMLCYKTKEGIDRSWSFTNIFEAIGVLDSFKVLLCNEETTSFEV